MTESRGTRVLRTLILLPENLGEENAALDTLVPELSLERELGHLSVLGHRRQLEEVACDNELQ